MTRIARRSGNVLPDLLKRRAGVVVDIWSTAAIRWTVYSYAAHCDPKPTVTKFHSRLSAALRQAWHPLQCDHSLSHEAPVPRQQISGKHRRVLDSLRPNV